MKTRSLAIGGTQSNRESFDNSNFYQKATMYGYQGVKTKYIGAGSHSVSATELKKISSKFDGSVASSVFTNRIPQVLTQDSETTPRDSNPYQPKFSSDKCVRNFMKQNISLKKMLKDRRLEREGSIPAKGVEEVKK